MPDPKIAIAITPGFLAEIEAAAAADDLGSLGLQWLGKQKKAINIGGWGFYWTATEGESPEARFAFSRGGCCCCRYWIIDDSGDRTPEGEYFVNVNHTFTFTLSAVEDPIPGEPAVRYVGFSILSDGMGDILVDGEKCQAGNWYVYSKEVVGDEAQSVDVTVECESLDSDSSHTQDPAW